MKDDQNACRSHCKRTRASLVSTMWASSMDTTCQYLSLPSHITVTALLEVANKALMMHAQKNFRFDIYYPYCTGIDIKSNSFLWVCYQSKLKKKSCCLELTKAQSNNKVTSSWKNRITILITRNIYFFSI